ncbi:MAG: RNA polymerase sigma factor [Sedimentisphaerales bacterium]|nr:RNA polymerase sigma factor [Sedimentisphaerales bacterium]
MTVKTGQNKHLGLIHRLRSGDRNAFGDFVKKYQNQVFLCCRLQGLSPHEAEDVASETFLAAYQGLDRYSGRAKLSTWLWRITYNKAISYIRQQSKQQKIYKKLQNEYNEEQPAQEPESQDNAEILWSAVQKLPAEQATAIVLYYRQEKSIKSIADIMNKRQNTVKVYLFRGRQKLKELLGEKMERLC